MKKSRRTYIRPLNFPPSASRTTTYKSVLTFETDAKDKYENITDFIQEELDFSGIKKGECIIRCPHTTCSIFLNETEKAIMKDLKTFLDSCVRSTTFSPALENFHKTHLINQNDNIALGFRHDCKDCSTCDRQNAAAHIKTILENAGAMVQVEIRDGKLDLGTYQSIILGEHDGPRKRELKIKIINDK